MSYSKINSFSCNSDKKIKEKFDESERCNTKFI